jgi:hypothetical protein
MDEEIKKPARSHLSFMTAYEKHISEDNPGNTHPQEAQS